MPSVQILRQFHFKLGCGMQLKIQSAAIFFSEAALWNDCCCFALIVIPWTIPTTPQQCWTSHLPFWGPFPALHCLWITQPSRWLQSLIFWDNLPTKIAVSMTEVAHDIYHCSGLHIVFLFLHIARALWFLHGAHVKLHEGFSYKKRKRTPFHRKKSTESLQIHQRLLK